MPRPAWRMPCNSRGARSAPAASPRCCSSSPAIRPYVRHRHGNDAGGARAVRERDLGDLDVRVAACAVVPLRRVDDRRAAMGVFILPLLVVLQTIPAFSAGARGAALVDSGKPMVRRARVVAALRLRELRAGRRPGHHLRAPVQGDQSEGARVLLRAAPLAEHARRDEPSCRENRLAVLDCRARSPARSGRRSCHPRAIRTRRCRWPIRRSSSQCCAGPCTRSSSTRSGPSDGAAAARLGSRRSGLRSCC